MKSLKFLHIWIKYLSLMLSLLLFIAPEMTLAQSGLADTDWPMFGHDLKHTRRSPYSVEVQTPAKRWKFLIPAGSLTYSSSPAIGSDGTIYIASYGSKLYAIPPDGITPYGSKLYAINPDGTKKWELLTGAQVRSSPAIGSDGTIYIASYIMGWVDPYSNGLLFAINPDGTEKWRFRAGSHIDSSPAIGSDGTIYIAPLRHLYSINTNGIKNWEFAIEGTVHSSPAIGSDGTIYLGTRPLPYGGPSGLYAINPDGTKKWKFSMNVVSSSPAIGSDGTIYVGSRDRKLYAINPDGTKKWKFSMNVVSSSPAIGSDGTIYVGSRDRKLYAINPDGTKKWEFLAGDAICSSPAIGSDGTIYVGSQDRKLYAINPDGTKKWEFLTGGVVYSSPAIDSDGIIYVESGDRKLYAINSDGTKKWEFLVEEEAVYGHSSPIIGSGRTVYLALERGLYAIGEGEEEEGETEEEAVSDTVPPQVISTNPPNGATNFSRGVNISAVFSENMKSDTIKNDTFIVKGSKSGRHLGVVYYDSNTKCAVFIKQGNYLDYDEIVTATITTEVEDLAGNHLPANYSWTFTTVAPLPTPPDLIVEDNISFEPANPTTQTPVIFTAKVKNQGEGSCGEFKVAVEHSRITPASKRVSGLSAGESIAVIFPSVTFPIQGHYIVRVKADSENRINESNENNNSRSKEIDIALPPPQPDFTISWLYEPPSSVNYGQEITLAVKVKNLGSVPGSDVGVRFFIDNVRTHPDTAHAIVSLGADSETIFQLPWTADIPGSHTLKAVVDPDNGINESDEDNNEATVQIQIGQAPSRVEAPVPPPQVIPSTLKQSYTKLANLLNSIDYRPSAKQKREFESILTKLLKEAKKNNLIIKTDIRKHFNWWYQYPHDKWNKKNTLKALENIKRQLDLKRR